MTADFEKRPPIPAEVKRRVLVEAGHRCAIPTCRHIETEIHHIVPWHLCKAHEYENLIALCANCHRRADRGEIDRKALRLYKFNLRFAHDKFSQIEMDMLFHLAALPTGRGEPWAPFMLIFFKRLFDMKYVSVVRSETSMMVVHGVRSDPAFLLVTDAGRQFIGELGFHEIDDTDDGN
ncbi:HNH endonuclease [Sphingobium sp. V4]|uniref:HNH endonuclease n=1 Tax=Sphingobium sp. V4 TaxID=3038927 RepID=UPI002558385C|nr:HNH endonuclease [Sphingobium sp. V4]WIW88939.1 HNH endonuclease [Sphingobium sp. V4]